MNNKSYERAFNMTIAESPRCDYMHVHEDVVKAVSEAMPEDEILYDLAELYKIFGDSTRIKILYVLLEAEMCVCDSKAQSWSRTAERAKPFFIRLQTTMSARLSVREWSMSQSNRV